MRKPEILPAGDSALVIDFGNEISEEINDAVHGLMAWLTAKNIAGITEMVPTFRSLMVCYEPRQVRFKALAAVIAEFSPESAAAGCNEKLVWQIPCCYEAEYAPDLSDMSTLLGLTPEEIIAIHSGTDYKIYMLGFLPGFVYLGGMDERIAAPRLQTPRVKIPAGSVAIGGSQTGVYPMDSPGGWRIIGSTPTDFYNPDREKPILCSAGEYIRFVPVSAGEYEAMKRDAAFMPQCIRKERG